MEVKKLVKLGYMVPGKCVCINLVYFVPKKEFNLYFEATVFGWSAIREGWSNFAQYLVARGLGDIFINEDAERVVRMGLVDDKIIRVGEPVLLGECEPINDANRAENNRTFQLDRFHPTLSSLMNMFELCPEIDKFLGAQQLAYVSMALESNVENTKRAELSQLMAEGAFTEANVVAFAKRCEEQHANRYVAANVESNGYAIMGQSAEKAGMANTLYSVGLSQFAGYEIYMHEDFPAFEMGLLMAEATRACAEGCSIEAINERLSNMKGLKKNRPRLVRSRTVRVSEMFLHRVKDNFETYRVMVDL